MGQGQNSSLLPLLETFSTGTPGTLQGVNSFLAQGAGQGGLPGFGEIFSNFEGAANKRIERQAAGLREAFGSRGARFGSDILRGEGALRTEGLQSIFAGAAPLRQAQTQQAVGLGGLALTAAQQETAIRESAAERAFLDQLRGSGAPPLLSGLANFALGLGGPSGQPTTFVT